VPAPLPVDAQLPEIVAAVRGHGAAVVVAPPGAGKTTRVPPALCSALGRVFVLQPRRVAARSVARRIAAERGWTPGEEVGWQVRMERRFSERTRLLIATEGILTARLAADPLLEGWAAVVLDEFHERSIHADLALAFVKQAAAARRGLHVVVMSATLDAGPVAEFLGRCPVVTVAGRPHPVELAYDPSASVAEAVRRRLREGDGDVLAFLPGAAEIRRTAAEISGVDAEVLPLHGGLDADAQDAALRPSPRRKVVLATNIAETSLTIEGVREVVDSGLHRVARYDASRAIDRLETERIPRDSADQRAGRAGRTAPGHALRLWDARDRLRERREPDVMRVDLTGPLLDILAWGGDPLAFEWLEPPPADRVRAALALLERLGAASGRRVTPLGERMRRVPLHPRLARLLLDEGGSARAAAACAALSERLPAPSSGDLTAESDLLVLADALPRMNPRLREIARELRDLARAAADPRPDGDGSTERFLRAVLAAWPDRVARRREPGSARLVLSSGAGAALARESAVRSEFLVAVELTAGDASREALVRLASAIEPEWLVPTARERVHALDPATGLARATERLLYDRLLLAEHPAPPDPDQAAALLEAEVLQRGLGEEAEAVVRRARFAGVEVDVARIAREACAGQVRLPRVDVLAALSPDARREVERHAPAALRLPSGREVPLEYRADGSVAASVRLQELFGLAETPRLGRRGEPVLLLLLAPNGRPVQTTRDLRSFWERTYPEVRRELRGRYPRHPWPEDPWTAPPTGVRRRSRELARRKK
jgi:ATP-dependent helicase HrpB